MEILLVAFGLVCVLAASYCVWISHRAGSTQELSSRVNQLSSDVQDLYDRQDRRDKRDAQRRSTESKEAVKRDQAPEQETIPVDRESRKAMMRRQLINRRNE